MLVAAPRTAAYRTRCRAYEPGEAGRGQRMRLGILDIGSNTVHLLVVDTEPGARPMPAANRRWDSPLLHQQNDDAEVTTDGERELVDLIEQAKACAAELGVADFSAFATSALREAK